MRWTRGQYDEYLKRRADSVSSSAISERSAGNESVAETSGENPDAAKCFVRVTSFRSKLIDGDNLHAKAFVDALQTAGAIYSDAPQWCKVEIEQIKVDYPWQQRTIIEISYL